MLTLSQMLVQALKAKGFVELKEAAKVMRVKYETLRKTVNEAHIPKDNVLLVYAEKLGIDANLLVMKAHQARAPEEMSSLFELATPRYPKLRRLMKEKCTRDRGRVLSEFYASSVSCLESLVYEAFTQWIIAIHEKAGEPPEPLANLVRRLAAGSSPDERFSALEANHEMLSKLLEGWHFDSQTAQIHLRFTAHKEPLSSKITLTYKKSALGRTPRSVNQPEFTRQPRLEGKADDAFRERLRNSAQPNPENSNSVSPGLRELIRSGDYGQLSDDEVEWLRRVTPQDGPRDKQFYAFALSLLRNSSLLVQSAGSAA